MRNRILIAAAAMAFALKLWLAFTTVGTNDVRTFELMLGKLEASGVEVLYREGTAAPRAPVMRMNHPPFVLTLLKSWGKLRTITGLPLGFWMRLTCALADLLGLWLVWRMIGTNGENWPAILVLALAPAGIAISGFHGNTDPIMIALAVLAVYFLAVHRSAWLAGAVFALACSVKVWPLIFAPLFLMQASITRRRLMFCASFAIVAAVVAMPWFLAAPMLILERVFGYGSNAGWWGLTYLAPALSGVLKPVVFATVLAAGVLLSRRGFSLYACCAIVSFAFLFLTPGFGPQYLAWVIPWTAAAGWRASAIFHILAGAFVFSMYTVWSTGFPWYFANSSLYPIPPWVFRIGVLAWAGLPLLIASAYRISRGPTCVAAAAPSRSSASPAIPGS